MFLEHQPFPENIFCSETGYMPEQVYIVLWKHLFSICYYYIAICLKNHVQSPPPNARHTCLQEYPAYEYGWSLTPVLPEHRPSNYIEWVLFEGQLLRNQQRVIRELRVFNDWSVEIHALGKKIHVNRKYTLQRTHSCVVKVRLDGFIPVSYMT